MQTRVGRREPATDDVAPVPNRVEPDGPGRHPMRWAIDQVPVFSGGQLYQVRRFKA